MLRTPGLGWLEPVSERLRSARNGSSRRSACGSNGMLGSGGSNPALAFAQPWSQSLPPCRRPTSAPSRAYLASGCSNVGPLRLCGRPPTNDGWNTRQHAPTLHTERTSGKHARKVEECALVWRPRLGPAYRVRFAGSRQWGRWIMTCIALILGKDAFANDAGVIFSRPESVSSALPQED